MMYVSRRVGLLWGRFVRCLSVLAVLGWCSSGYAQVEIQWWHSMTAVNADWINDLAKSFNSSQKDYRVVPVYKGSYDETFSAAVAAQRAGNAPHIAQIAEVHTANIMANKNAIVSVSQLMQDAGQRFDPSVYISAISNYYSAPDGKMLSLPFNSSTTIFYYNKDALKAAGVESLPSPNTWPSVVQVAKQLKAAGHSCPLTVGWEGWTQLESFSLWHNVEFASHNNGFGGPQARLKVNSPLHVRHIENLASLHKQGLFVYKGRGNAAEASFLSSECAMLISSSGFYGNARTNARFNHGAASLPYYPDVRGAPYTTAIGGASLWVPAGKKPEEYKGIAKFFAFISNPTVQAASHQRTGYLPTTQAAYALTEQAGFYKNTPDSDVAINQMLRKTTNSTHGIRLGYYPQLRAIEDEELEQVWAEKKSTSEALNSIVQRGNEQLERFEKLQKSKASN